MGFVNIIGSFTSCYVATGMILFPLWTLPLKANYYSTLPLFLMLKFSLFSTFMCLTILIIILFHLAYISALDDQAP